MKYVPTDWPQKVDQKNGVICLVIMLFPRVVVIMSQLAHFVYFFAGGSQK